MIVLFGATGYVGSAIAAALNRHDVPFLSPCREELDLSQTEAITRFLKASRASFLINSVGYTGRPTVDACEEAKAECLDGNAVLPGRIRQACRRVGIPFGHVSSGCLYSGNRPDGGGFREDDLPNFSFRHGPCSFYSGCKALGEEVLADCASCFVWRLRIPFNHIDGSRNYLSKLQRYERLLDTTNSLSHLDEFADACVLSWIKRIPFGTYNVVNGGSVNTRRLTQKIGQWLPRDRPFRFFADDQEFYRETGAVPRSNCVLDNTKLLNAGIPMRSVDEAIELSLRNWKPELL